VAGACAGRSGLLTSAIPSAFAGNLTLFGSIADPIVVESAGKLDTTVGVGAYVRVGAPITRTTLQLGAVWLARTGLAG
jgi:Na+/H+ antiporter NhaD/arsenite permease-like protein